MANVADLNLIQINNFPEITNPSEWIVVSDAAGTAYKISKENFKDFLGTVTVTAPKPIGPSDVTPELDGVYIPTVVGVYPNFGGLERLESDGYVQFLKNGAVYAKVNTPMPMQDISDLATKEEVIPIIDAFTTSNQIFDKSKTIAGYFHDNGTRPSSTSTMSVLIPLRSEAAAITVSKSEFLTIIIADKAQFFNDVGDIIEHIPNINGLVELINYPIPDGAVSMGLNIASKPSSEGAVTDPTNNRFVNDLMVNYGAESLPYETYSAQVKQSALIETNERLSEIETRVNEIGQESPNLIDKSKIVFGRYDDNTGAAIASATTIRTPLIPINPALGVISYNSSASLATSIVNRLFYFDEDQVFISAIGKNANTQGLTLPANARFIAANITTQSSGVITDPTNNQWVNGLQLEYSSESSSYKPYGVLIDSSRIIRSTTPVTMEVIDESNFIIHSLHDNGETVHHVWQKNNKTIIEGEPPRLDDSWQATQIIYKGDVIVQGSFNWIHVVNKPNESGQHVGTGHGAEELLSAHFYVDGNEIVIGDNIGNTIQGDVFTFDIQNRIAAVDQAATTNPSDVVIQLDVDDNPIWSTMHYMHGFIKGNSFHGFDNKLRILRPDTSFVTCYLGMHNTYPVFWDKIQVMNGENSINDIATLTPIAPSTASLSGYTYNMADGERGELANVIRSYSDNGWIFETRAWGKDNDVTKKITMYINATSKKAYVQPVITTEIASSRGIALDVFQIGDVIEGYVERSLIL